MSFWSSSRPFFLAFNQIRGTISILIGVLSMAAIGQAQEAEDFFRQNCVSCHTVGGGRLTGPDLKNVTGRKERGCSAGGCFSRRRPKPVDRLGPREVSVSREGRLERKGAAYDSRAESQADRRGLVCSR